MGTAINTLATPLTRAPGQALTPPTPRLTHPRTAQAAQNGGVAQRSEFCVDELVESCSKSSYSFSLCHVAQHLQTLFGILLLFFDVRTSWWHGTDMIMSVPCRPALRYLFWCVIIFWPVHVRNQSMWEDLCQEHEVQNVERNCARHSCEKCKNLQSLVYWICNLALLVKYMHAMMLAL